MIGTTKRPLACLLLVALLLPLLTSCKTYGGNPQDSAQSTTAQVNDEQPEQTAFTWSDYRITYQPGDWPDGQITVEQFEQFATLLITTMQQRFGTAPTQYGVASVCADEDAPRIHLAYDPAMASEDYQVVVTAGTRPDILLSVKNASALVGAVNAFCEDWLPWDGSQPAELRFYAHTQSLASPKMFLYDGVYYLPQSTENGYAISKGVNFYKMGEPKTVFDASTCTHPDFDGMGKYGTPSLHEYHGKFYLLASYQSESTLDLGIAVFRSDTPDGTYELISKGQLQPTGWDADDPTLYVDPTGRPWMIFVHEWSSMSDWMGDISAVRLSEDLTETVGEFHTLFRANECPAYPTNQVTDAPCVDTLSDGMLVMLWSGSSGGTFTGVAYSTDGILGPWKQAEEPLFSADTVFPENFFGLGGGSPSLFRDQSGRLRMSLSIRTGAGDESLSVFLHIDDSDGILKLR